MTTLGFSLSRVSRLVITMFCIAFCANAAFAQTTGFTYQGRVTDGGTPANGNYDLQFVLWDSASGGNQVGLTQVLNAMPVEAGIFTVTLDFGANAFPGANRFLEISARPSGALSFTLLTPRQQITSTPYSVRSLNSASSDTATNATQLGGIAASQYVQASDIRLTDPRPPTPGSSSYIQNTASPQASTNFNISGNGTAAGTLSANVVNATTQYNIGAGRVLIASGAGNVFAGFNAGAANTTGSNNAFFGDKAGRFSKAGYFDSFFGSEAGNNNTNGSYNSFFGHDAGLSNTEGNANTFVGESAGQANTTANNNSFFGANAGYNDDVGDLNSFFGSGAGNKTTSGAGNTFIGTFAGLFNTTGNSNTLIGSNAEVQSVNLTNATAIGASAMVSANNSLVLGSINGVNSSFDDTNVGIGTTAPKARLHIAVNSGNIMAGNAGCNPGFVGFGFASSLTCTNYSLLGNGTDTIINRPTGGAISFRENNTPQMTIFPGGAISILTLGVAGNQPLCRNSAGQFSTCSSSLRYKKDLRPFTRGLALLNQLKPITFNWKSDGSPDLGFGAEDVAAVEPLLVTRNDKGEVEGVKYDRITAVLVNAVKEQQAQFEAQQDQIKQQQQVIAEQQSQLRTLHQEVGSLKQLIGNRRQRASRRR